MSKLPHRDLDLEQSLKAFSAAQAAINIGVIFFTLAVINLPFQEAAMASGVRTIGIASGTLYYTWVVERWWIWVGLALLVIYPIWFFALASLRPVTGIVMWAFMIVYTIGSSLLLQPPEVWRWVAAQPGAVYSFLPTLAIFVILYALLLRAPLAALPLRAAERAAARPLAPVRSYFGLLRAMTGVWPNLRRSWSTALLSTLLVYSSMALTAINVLWRTVLAVLAGAGGAYWLFLNASWLQELTRGETTWDQASYVAELVGFGVTALLAYLLAVLIQWIAQLLRAQARRLSRQSLEAQIARDPRPPILFLRSFADDQVTLPKQGFWARFLRGEPKRRRLDHLLVEDFTRYGPVVAIGRPGEADLPFGAARIYVNDERWQDEVKALAARAAHIVIVADATPGVGWELETTLNAFQEKTLCSPRRAATCLPMPCCSDGLSQTPRSPTATVFSSRSIAIAARSALSMSRSPASTPIKSRCKLSFAGRRLSWRRRSPCHRVCRAVTSMMTRFAEISSPKIRPSHISQVGRRSA